MAVRFRSNRPVKIRFPQRRLSILSAVFVCVFSGFLITDLKFRPLIATTARALALRAAAEALNEAITEEIAQDADYNHIVQVERGKNGSIPVAHFDFASVTHLQYTATTRANLALRDLQHETLKLPLSQLFGGSIFAALGPNLPVRIMQVGSVHSSVQAEVKSVGINQTVHQLYLDLTANVNVIAPLIADPVIVQSRVPIAYVVLNGEVPNTYMNSNGAIVPVPPSGGPTH